MFSLLALTLQRITYEISDKYSYFSCNNEVEITCEYILYLTSVMHRGNVKFQGRMLHLSSQIYGVHFRSTIFWGGNSEAVSKDVKDAGTFHIISLEQYVMLQQAIGCAETYAPYSHRKQSFLVAAVMIEVIIVAVVAILVVAIVAVNCFLFFLAAGKPLEKHI